MRVESVIGCAVQILKKANRDNPADAVLREQLRHSNLSREEGGKVADLVFAYYRWMRWLNPAEPLPDQLKMAADIAQRFHREPERFEAEDLRRAGPEWFIDEVRATPDLFRSLQREPVMWLRAKRGTGATLARKLGNVRNAAKTLPGAAGDTLADAVSYVGKEDLFRTPGFHAGDFEIQDIASQLVGLICAPQPGETWWDACAGEGGKLLHLSDLMGNKGLIWASDRAEWRLKRLKQRAARAKAFNYRTAPWDGGPKLPTKTRFDGILVDAPCSGTGTWQRNPHARWTTTIEDVRELAEIQKSLLVHASAALKPGGRLIYSVCSMTQSETEGVADFCSRALSGFAPLLLPALPSGQQEASARKWIWPQDFLGNGMYVAAWQRLQ